MMRTVVAVALAAAVSAVMPGTGRPDATPCPGTPNVFIELQPTGPVPLNASLQVGQTLAFVNQTSGAITVTTTLQGQAASLDPGACAVFSGEIGQYQYTAGYPGGDIVGIFSIVPAPIVTIAQHASIVYGTRTVISGTAQGPAGEPVVISARPLDVAEPTQIASVAPVDGSWHIAVAPRVATEYTAFFAGVQDQRILRVTLELRVRRTGHTVIASVVPRLGHSTVLLFRFTPNLLLVWSGFRTAHVDAYGVARFKNVPTGRYYVAVLGGSLYLDTASEPFSVGR
jgi:hypothetical protein